MIDPQSPLYNSMICYILVIILILVTKPKIMYSEKNNKFKSFGLDENQTLCSFPMISICTGILLYIIFAIIDIITTKLNNLN
jgi:TRAP-type C4-dicarboxylate transport system permease small subunit